MFVFICFTINYRLYCIRFTKWPNSFTRKYMEKVFFLKKDFIVALTFWFILCILPGDCFVLGCGEKDSFHSGERESAVLSHTGDCSSVPSDDQHCSHCCLLCSHNLVIGLLQNSLLFLRVSSSWLQHIRFDHFKSIFQTIIYHPPRLAV